MRPSTGVSVVSVVAKLSGPVGVSDVLITYLVGYCMDFGFKSSSQGTGLKLN